MSLSGVAAEGDRRRTLEALRDTLAASIEAVDAKDRAPLARQLTIVLAQLDELAEPGEASALDQLAARRASRKSGSDAAGGARKGVKRGAGGG